MKSFDLGRIPPVTFGPGVIRDVSTIVKNLGGGSALIIADAALVETGLADSMLEALSANHIAFDVAADIQGEPKEWLVDSLCTKARDSKANVIIGFGGGASMDAAKVVAAIAEAGKSVRNFALSAEALPKNRLPAIAVPTTAGTGSEVTRTSIISTDDGLKKWYWGEELMFAHAILDPELTLSLPSHLTAWTGIDAVVHALEGATSGSVNSFGRMCGFEALEILSDALPRVVENGADIDARGRVLWGSMVAGLALNNCNMHMGHNISHALGSLSRIHHGLATGLSLEAALPWLVAKPEGEENYALAAQAMGGSTSASKLPEIFAKLMRSCNIPSQLPIVCANVTMEALAAEMKNEANYAMSQNAACRITHQDLSELAGLVMNIPLEEEAA